MQPNIFSVQLNATEKNNYSSSAVVTSSSLASLNKVELAAIRMTGSGLKGITYEVRSQRRKRINLGLSIF
jgi:hypothetical protein